MLMSAKQRSTIVTSMQVVTTRLVHSTAPATLATREMVLIALMSMNVKTTLITVTKMLGVKITKVLSTARVIQAITEMESIARI